MMIGIIGVHLLFTVVMSGLALLLKREGKILWITFGICFFLPIGGYIIVLIFLLKKRGKNKQIEEDFFEEDLFLFTERLQKKDHLSAIPIEETLLFNDNKVKRRKMNDILREDPLEYMDILKMALHDQDVETSHYASSAISEVKRKLNLQLQKYNVKYKEAQDDVGFLEDYARVLKTYLESGLLDKYSYKRYSYLCLEVLTKLSQEKPSPKCYEDLIDIGFASNELGKVREATKAFYNFLECESSYIQLLRYFYVIRDKEKFWETFNQLRNSEIVLSQMGLETVRFWMEMNDEK